MRIMQAQKADYDEIMAVWEASVRATHDFLKEEDIVALRPLIRNEYLDAVTLWCARSEDGTLAGFMGISGESIEMLFLAPEARGCGLGRKLVTFAVETESVRYVDVNEQNPQARGFYEHMGFRIVARSALDGQGKPFPLLHMSL